jgi:hypothetical protein
MALRPLRSRDRRRAFGCHRIDGPAGCPVQVRSSNSLDPTAATCRAIGSLSHQRGLAASRRASRETARGATGPVVRCRCGDSLLGVSACASPRTALPASPSSPQSRDAWQSVIKRSRPRRHADQMGGIWACHLTASVDTRLDRRTPAGYTELTFSGSGHVTGTGERRPDSWSILASTASYVLVTHCSPYPLEG